jgi:hypothetical protein
MTFHYPRYTSWGKRHSGWAAIANGVILFVVIAAVGNALYFGLAYLLAAGRMW